MNLILVIIATNGSREFSNPIVILLQCFFPLGVKSTVFGLESMWINTPARDLSLRLRVIMKHALPITSTASSHRAIKNIHGFVSAPSSQNDTHILNTYCEIYVDISLLFTVLILSQIVING